MKSKRQLDLEAYLAEDPQDPFLHYALALEYVKAGNQTEGLAELRWLMQNKPDYLATYYQLGKLYEQLNQHKEAIAVYRQGSELAEFLKNRHAFNELKSALDELDEA